MRYTCVYVYVKYASKAAIFSNSFVISFVLREYFLSNESFRHHYYPWKAFIQMESRKNRRRAYCGPKILVPLCRSPGEDGAVLVRRRAGTTLREQVTRSSLSRLDGTKMDPPVGRPLFIRAEVLFRARRFVSAFTRRTLCYVPQKTHCRSLSTSLFLLFPRDRCLKIPTAG